MRIEHTVTQHKLLLIVVYHMTVANTATSHQPDSATEYFWEQWKPNSIHITRSTIDTILFTGWSKEHLKSWMMDNLNISSAHYILQPSYGTGPSWEPAVQIRFLSSLDLASFKLSV
jgi:hypothetical protein